MSDVNHPIHFGPQVIVCGVDVILQRCPAAGGRIGMFVSSSAGQSLIVKMTPHLCVHCPQRMIHIL